MDAHVDVALFGGGIAGLWTLNVLRRRGYSAVLVEKEALGAGQTLASQGMIHGGQKYRLADLKAAVAEMPPIWDGALEGKGEVDLRGAAVLSDHQVLWAGGGFLANLAGFAAAKITQARTRKLEDRDEWPAALRGVEGAVYRLEEKVLDVKSVVEALRRPHAGRLVRSEIRDLRLEGERVASVELAGGTTLKAARYLFCAGEGNEEAARRLGLGSDVTQRRPLQQILVRGLKESLYGHCIGLNRDKPRVTVTTHGPVWYLGGGVAEEAAGRPADEAIRKARADMKEILPHLAWDDCEWAAFPIDRAEPFAKGRLPDRPELRVQGNAALAWPTKMTLAPALAARVAEWLERDGVRPGGVDAAISLPEPAIGACPWERDLSWRRVR